ncbi:MAG: HEPN domain-containing protein [Clostridiales bacterium]|jgi:uncharacterized protein (UPF0332 family)|nr:HEPN domain-containing protein [Clostridiales bacterium]
MPKDYSKDLINYRLERAAECLRDARDDLGADSLYSAANRIYYAVFQSMRAALARDGVDFSKHSGVIAYFRKQYIKTGLIAKEYSDLIRNAESIRSESDYSDFFTPEKEELEWLMKNAQEFWNAIKTIVAQSENGNTNE